MLNEEKIRSKIKELKEQKFYNSIEWTEEGSQIGYDNQVTDGMTTGSLQFRLEEISSFTVKLYVKINHVYIGIMVFNKDF